MSDDTPPAVEKVTLPNAVTDALRDAIASAAFKAPVMKQFQELAEKVQQLESHQSYLRDQAYSAEEEKRKAHNYARDLEAELKKWTDRETAIISREGELFTLEKRTAVAEARADELRAVFQTIFKPPAVRRDVQRTMGSSGHPNENITETEE